MPVLSQSQIDDLLKNLLQDTSVLPDVKPAPVPEPVTSAQGGIDALIKSLTSNNS